MQTLKLCLLLTSIAYSISHPQESTTAVASIIASTTINVTDDLMAINNTDNSKFNVSLVRITQPSSNIERFSNVKDEIPVRNTTKSNFIPSPQLETYIEYNKFPVVPAYPEAKHMYSQFSYIPPSTKYQPAAEDKKGYTGMTQANMKTEKTNENSNDNKYYYVKPEYGVPQLTTTTDKPIPSAQDKQLFPSSFEKPLRTDSDFPSFKYYERFNYLGPSSSSNTLYPTVPSLEWYNKMSYPIKTSPISVADHPYPFVTDLTKKEAYPIITAPKSMMSEFGKMSPWKRAAKIFAAILPIGLLISALTPNILTIGPVNATSNQQCRKLAARAEVLGLDKISIEKWSKPGCEAKLLCETAIREDSLDTETVKKLFWSFVSQNAEDSETPEELEAVSNAIQQKRCDKISCRQVKKKSSRDNV